MKKWLPLLWIVSSLLCLCACGDDTIQETAPSHYPKDMLASFTDLYNRNDDVRGWIEYHATGDEDFLDIVYPIVYSGDNTKYLNLDFDGNKDSNGTLFFDESNKVDSSQDENRVLIVYGHNMASGQRFAGLNKLLGSVNNARAAASLTLSTLFREDEYRVFAVVLIDEADKNELSYNMWKTDFNNDAEFLRHVEEIQKRSLFEYPDVDVTADDKLLVLSTCTGKSSAHVKDGRLLVVARRVRDREKNTTVDTSGIKKNVDVLMPYSWYVNQNLSIPDEYKAYGAGSQTGTTTGSTTGSTTGTTTGTTTGSTAAAPTSTTKGGVSTTTTESQGTTTTSGEVEHVHVFGDCEDTICNGCDTTREPLEHNFVVTSTEEATCVDDGWIKRNCSECGKPSNEMLPATGEHTYDENGECTGCGAEKPAE